MYWHCLIGSVQRDSRHFNGLYIKQSEDELRSQTWNDPWSPVCAGWALEVVMLRLHIPLLIRKEHRKTEDLSLFHARMNEQICAGFPPRLFVLRNQIHLRQIRGAPSVPSLCPGILPLALQSLHSSAGLSKARPCRRLQWAAVMGLKLCALIRPVCQRWIPAVTQPHPNPASHLSPFPSLFHFSETCLLFMIVPGQYSRWTSQ